MFEQITSILLYVLPGFVAIETASLITPKVLVVKKTEEKVFSMLLFSGILYCLFIIITQKTWNYKPELKPDVILPIMVISVIGGFIWGIIQYFTSSWWFDKKFLDNKAINWVLKKTQLYETVKYIYTGNETVMETVLRRNQGKWLDLFLKDGTLITGYIDIRPHDYSDKGLYIKPLWFYYESQYILEKENKTVLQHLRSEIDIKEGKRYEGIYITLDEIKMIKFIDPLFSVPEVAADLPAL